ncbi:MAG: hypothetical protein KF752_00145 [Pirellulaceae bacterium]|nr:hypothetical protein [Pirellulaceae bacterium]
MGRLVWFLNILLTLSIGAAAWAGEPLPEGLTLIPGGQHARIITDLPLDNELRQLPELFDQAMPQWCQAFDVKSEQARHWQVTVYIMLDRGRFRQAGLIADDLPQFNHGWQAGDKIWVVDQPSPYYRRHLLLHEGTHWFMFRRYGQYHAPWLMEGLAEFHGTHRIVDARLTLGIIPQTRDEVPFWGRVKLIRQQSEQYPAPSLDAILRYSSSAHQQVEAYAWSWALVLFLKQHPETSQLFATMLKQPAMDSTQLQRWLRSRLAAKLPRLRAEWIAFIDELDYGFTDSNGWLTLSEQTRQVSAPEQILVRADRNWQATGLSVEAGQQLTFSATGEFVVGQQPGPWICQPQGVTLEYHRGQPLGTLMLAVAGPIDSEPEHTDGLAQWPVGRQATITVPHSGELFLRINEAVAGLGDNSGSLQVTIIP